MTPFSVEHRDPSCSARTASLALGHGTVPTPCFMPVGTNASVKAIRYEDLEDLGVNLILSNTYHLYLRPGRDVIASARGLHSFMGWPHNILTDSGGYQIFSLSSFRTVEEGGVAFRSHIAGSAQGQGGGAVGGGDGPGVAELQRAGVADDACCGSSR